jgi:PKD repeat protein
MLRLSLLSKVFSLGIILVLVSVCPAQSQNDDSNDKDVPKVTVTATPSGGAAPLIVNFFSQTKNFRGDTLYYDWDFGDGGSGTGISPSHTYEAEDAYSATVVVTSNKNNETATDSSIISVAAGVSLLQVLHSNSHPTRVTRGPDGYLYVTDPKVGSVFIYDDWLQIVGELKGLVHPVGVAVGSDGRIFVGNAGAENVEVYSSAGEYLFAIGSDRFGGIPSDDTPIPTPRDIALDQDGNLYVVDTQNDVVRVYDTNGTWLRDIGGPGDGEANLSSPSAVTIAYRPDGNGGMMGELYVADRRHQVKVFDLQGNLNRYFGSSGSMWSGDWKNNFWRLQSLAVDGMGRLHTIDSYWNVVKILDAETGVFIDYYGSFGTEPGKLNVPLDIFISSGESVVTNYDNHRLEVFTLN